MITKQMIKKLSKEKQKELSERLNEYEAKAPYFMEFFITYLKWTIYIFAFSLVVIPLWVLAFGMDNGLVVASTFISVLKVMSIALVVGLLLDFAYLVLKIIKEDKIKREYFDIKIKAKTR